MDDNPPIPGEPLDGKPISGRKPAGGDPLSKRRSQNSGDRLSALPDLPLVHIFSHLPAEDAAKTTVLSKRFVSVSNHVTALNLSDENSGKDGVVFVSFVNKALGFHHGRTLERLSIKFRYISAFSKSVDKWIRFAVQKKVNSLHLDFVQNSRINHLVADEHKLPKFLRKSENLIELVTSCCRFPKIGNVNWNSLRKLSIGRTELSEEAISGIVSGSPVLETLEVREWSGFDRLKISSGSLRVLRLVGEKLPRYLIPPNYEVLLEVSGPNLSVLEVSGTLYRTKVKLSDMGSLASANVGFEIKPERVERSSWYDVRDQDIAREVLESLCLVEALTVGGWCLKVLSKWEAYDLPSPWSERKSLTLSTSVIAWNLLGIASLLRSSPYLETLVIRLSYCSPVCASQHTHDAFNERDDDYYWKSWSAISKFPLLHLKNVKVVGCEVPHGAMKPVFQFLQFLLRHARALDKIVIQTSQYVARGALEQALDLLSVSTASPDVVVHFEPPHLWIDPLCAEPNCALL